MLSRSEGAGAESRIGPEGNRRGAQTPPGCDQRAVAGGRAGGRRHHGHIDDICRFVNPRTVVLIRETNPKDENYRPLAENWHRIQDFRLEDGSKPEVVALPCRRRSASTAIACPPATQLLHRQRAVLVPTFNDPNDRIALGRLAELFPDREVVGIMRWTWCWASARCTASPSNSPAKVPPGSCGAPVVFLRADLVVGVGLGELLQTLTLAQAEGRNRRLILRRLRRRGGTRRGLGNGGRRCLRRGRGRRRTRRCFSGLDGLGASAAARDLAAASASALACAFLALSSFARAPCSPGRPSGRSFLGSGLLLAASFSCFSRRSCSARLRPAALLRSARGLELARRGRRRIGGGKQNHALVHTRAQPPPAPRSWVAPPGGGRRGRRRGRRQGSFGNLRFRHCRRGGVAEDGVVSAGAGGAATGLMSTGSGSL